MMQRFLVSITLLGAAVDASNLRNGARRAATGFLWGVGPDEVAFPKECTNDCEGKWETISSELSLAIGPSGNPEGSPPLTDPGSLKPGCYENTGAFMLTSTLTLIGDTSKPLEKFVFRTPAALNTAAGSEVILTDAASKNVFWCIEAAVTMGALTNFQGDVYAGAAITVGANVNIGQLMSGAATTLGADVNVQGSLTAAAAVTLGANACIEGEIGTGAGMTTGAGQRSAYSADWTLHPISAGVDAYPLGAKKVFVKECSDAADTVQLWATANNFTPPVAA